jgi:transitional endoplasmic reticulum ATPase
MSHFREALKEVEPSATREVSIEVPNVKWDQVGGLEQVKRRLIEAIEWPLKYAELFEVSNTIPPKGILLYGSPGTGKTLLARAVATESEVNFISIKGPELLSKWVGESEKGVRELFKKARQASPCILFFDEMDAIAPVRGSGTGDSHVTERVISQLLTELDGIEGLKNVVIIAATNRLDIIDPAVLRPGRFDYLIELPLPDLDTRQAIFQVHLKNKPLARNVDIKILAQDTEGMSGAEIESVCRSASMSAIRDIVESHREGPFDYSKLKITKAHLTQAIEDAAKRS